MRNTHRHLLLLAAAASVPAAASAQNSHVAPSPQRYANLWAGNNGSGVGIAVTSALTSRSQQLYVAPLPANSGITSVAFRRTANDDDYAAYTVDAEIALGSSSATPATLSSAFATNLTPDYTIVVPRQVYNIAAYPANSSPHDWITFPLSQPWQYQGPNLLVDMLCHASTNTNPTLRLDRCFASTSGEAINFGTNCGGATISSTSTNRYLPGSTVDVSLAGAAANLPAFLATGFDAALLAGAVPLPFDLASVGAPGCLLHVDPVATATLVTDPTGGASLPLPLPNNPSLSNVGVAFQWIYVDPNAGNPLNLAVTAARLMNIGPRTCPNNGYVYSFDVNDLTGATQAGGPIARFTTQ